MHAFELASRQLAVVKISASTAQLGIKNKLKIAFKAEIEGDKVIAQFANSEQQQSLLEL